jgi:hypothetical protein
VNPGIPVEAVGPGVISGVSGNPIASGSGAYGAPGPIGSKLIVQGDIESGTPIEFYVGGEKAEVFPVATNGPWLEAYPYLPGEVTELNLRISSQPSTGVTREPTPVQTRIPSGQVPTISGYSGPALPRPEVVAVNQGDSSQENPAQLLSSPTITPGDSSGNPVGGDQQIDTTSPIPLATKSSGILSGTAIVAFLVIIGMAVYQKSRR